MYSLYVVSCAHYNMTLRSNDIVFISRSLISLVCHYIGRSHFVTHSPIDEHLGCSRIFWLLQIKLLLAMMCVSLDIHFHFIWVMTKNAMTGSLLAGTLGISHYPTVPWAMLTFFSLFFSLGNSTDLYSSWPILSLFTSIPLLNPLANLLFQIFYFFSSKISDWLVYNYVFYITSEISLFFHSSPLYSLYLIEQF